MLNFQRVLFYYRIDFFNTLCVTQVVNAESVRTTNVSPIVPVIIKDSKGISNGYWAFCSSGLVANKMLRKKNILGIAHITVDIIGT